MEMLELQKWINENREPLTNYKLYLEKLCNDLVPSIINNSTDNNMDLINKGKVQLLLMLIKQLS